MSLTPRALSSLMDAFKSGDWWSRPAGRRWEGLMPELKSFWLGKHFKSVPPRQFRRLQRDRKARRKHRNDNKNITPCPSLTYTPSTQRNLHRKQHVKLEKQFLTRHTPALAPICPLLFSMYLLLPPVPYPQRFCILLATGGNYVAKEGRNKRSVRTWLPYMYKKVKQVHCDDGNSNRTANDETSFINDMIHRHRDGRGVTQGNNQCV